MTPKQQLETLKRELGAGRFIEANGCRVHYARCGSGPTLILLHGWPEFWLTWRRNIAALARQFEVLAPDLRGFGESRSLNRPADAPLTPQDISEDLRAFMDGLGIERAGLVSHDVGANGVQAFARRHPARITGLYFFNCPHPGIGRRWADADSLPETWYQYFNQLPLARQLVGYNRDTLRLYIGHALSHWSADPSAFDADLELWVENFSAPEALAGGFAWYRGIDAARREFIRNGPPELPPIPHPARAFWGRHDPVLRPQWRDTLADTFADIEIELCEGAGHFVHYEAADEANADIAAFFSGRGAAA